MNVKREIFLKAVVGTAVLSLALFTSIGKELALKADQVILFQSRNLFGQETRLDKRLHILAWDDKTVQSGFHGPMPPDVSTKLVTFLSSLGTHSIILDAAFGQKADSFDLPSLSKSEKSKIYSLAFAQKGIQSSSPYDLDLQGGVRISSDNSTKSKALLDTLSLGERHLYAYNKEMDGVLLAPRVGMYAAQRWEAPAFLHKNGLSLPNLGLMVRNDIHLADGALILGEGEQRVELSHEGGIPINFLRPEVLARQTYSIGSILQDLDRYRDIIRPGDVVIVSYNFYTGNSDNSFSPVGQMHGTYIIASIVNSVLRNSWLVRFDHHWLLIMIGILVAFPLGLSLERRPVSLWGAGLFGLGLLAVAVSLFSIKGVIIPICTPLFAHLCTMGLLRIRSTETLREKGEEERLQRLREEEAKRRVEARIDEGRKVQQLLFPENDLEIRAEGALYRVQYLHRSHFELSGDWVASWGRKDDWPAIFIGDVCGKGTGAAFSHAYIAGALATIALMGCKLSESFNLIQKILFSRFQNQTNTTLAAVQMLPNGRLRVMNALSGFVWLMGSKTGFDASFRSASPVNLVDEEESIPEKEYSLSVGDVLFMFTDGIFDQANRKACQLFQTQCEGAGKLSFRELCSSIEAFAARLEESRAKQVLAREMRTDESESELQERSQILAAQWQDDKTLLYIERLQ